jgi:hypothetical protein
LANADDCALAVSSLLNVVRAAERYFQVKLMSEFKKKGFVSYNGGLQINSALVVGFQQTRPMSVAPKG